MHLHTISVQIPCLYYRKMRVTYHQLYHMTQEKTSSESVHHVLKTWEKCENAGSPCALARRFPRHLGCNSTQLILLFLRKEVRHRLALYLAVVILAGCDLLSRIKAHNNRTMLIEWRGCLDVFFCLEDAQEVYLPGKTSKSGVNMACAQSTTYLLVNQVPSGRQTKFQKVMPGAPGTPTSSLQGHSKSGKDHVQCIHHIPALHDPLPLFQRRLPTARADGKPF